MIERRIQCRNTPSWLPQLKLWDRLVWNRNEYDPRCGAVEFIYHGLKHKWQRLVCRVRGHKLVGCGYGGPDSGNDDHYCERCGQYWRVTLY